jgi:hypothetical protein
MSWTFDTHQEFIGHPYIFPRVQSGMLAQSCTTYSPMACLSSSLFTKHGLAARDEVLNNSTCSCFADVGIDEVLDDSSDSCFTNEGREEVRDDSSGPLSLNAGAEEKLVDSSDCNAGMKEVLDD